VPNETINLTVDGQPATAQASETLLAVCRRIGKDIPTLCHHESLEPYAACRVCLVEVRAGARISLVPSCQYPCAAGLEVLTDSEMVRTGRKLVLELLLARCPGSDVIKRLAARYGVTSTPFPTEDPKQTCILCGLCVRACEEELKIGALGFAQRGIDRLVGTPFDEASKVCVGCLACVNVCPTGHVKTSDVGAVRRMETWKTDLPLEACERCGRHFATDRHLQYLRAKLPEHIPVPTICPACQRSATVERMTDKAPACERVGCPTRNEPK
jgi:predicted molibdopterin-dependent oxidoreductase YjgC